MKNYMYYISISILGGLLISILSLSACTDDERVKSYGGTKKIYLDMNQKLTFVTFKGNDLWILSRPMLPTDSVVMHTFKEDSKFGILTGTILIYETKGTEPE